MLFCSQQFTLFFAVVWAVYWALPHAFRFRCWTPGQEPWHRPRVWLLLVASFYFYASWNHWLALIICADHGDGLFRRPRHGRQPLGPPAPRLLLVLSLVVNLGLLVYFKYANFFLQSVEEALQAAGATASLPVLKVILPIGISFYTFEAINYTVDVYRRRIQAEPNLANFMLFITFFPHLVAGPIVRARDFLPQIRRRKQLGLGAGCNWGPSSF